jgi:hypothetical protein
METCGSVALILICPLSMKSWYEAQSVEYHINWEIYTPYAHAGFAGMLLHNNTGYGKSVTV